MSSPATDTPSDNNASWSAQAGRLMRTHPRQAWLVPLLAVPLSQLALSPCCPSDVLDWCVPGHDLAALRRAAADVEAAASAVAASNRSRGLTAEEAWLLLQFSHDYVGLGYAILMPSPFLMVGMEAAPGLPTGPRLHVVAEWIASGALPVPMAAFITARALAMAEHPPMFLPKMDSHFAPVTRAIDGRLEEQGVATWEDALALAHRFWTSAGWRDLGVWQEHTFYLVGTKDAYKTERDHREEEHETQRRRHRAERRRLQEAATKAQEELPRLRPLQTKVDGLRAETERLRNREAELAEARDRAVARVKALEAANAKLEREGKETSRRLAALTPLPEPGARAGASRSPARGRGTGASRHPARRSGGILLHRRAAQVVRRGHRRIPAAQRPRRSRHPLSRPQPVRPDRAPSPPERAQFLVVRSGKGSLARTVVTALLRERH